MLDQAVVISLREPGLAFQFMSGRVVRCPDCPYEFVAGFEWGEPRGLLYPGRTAGHLAAHARHADTPHPSVLGRHPALRRTA